MASRGMTNRQVAGDLCVSVHAVKFHLGSVYRKLGVANRTQATTRATEDIVFSPSGARRTSKTRHSSGEDATGLDGTDTSGGA